MRKNLLLWIVMLLLPCLAALNLHNALENYHAVVHNDSAFLVQALCLICAVAEFVIWKRNRKKHCAYTVFLAIALALLAVVFHIGGKIPFCVECDRVTAEDLGFLTKWITPIDA